MTYPQQGYPQQPAQQFQAPQGYGQPQQAPVQNPQFTAPPAPPQGYPQQPQQGGFFGGQPQQQAQPAAPMPSRQVSNTADFFGGAPTISFNDRVGYQRGTFRGGRVVRKEESVQTKMGTGEILTYGDGTPRKQLIITLATGERSDATDNGERRLFVKGDMVRAVGSAFQSVGAPDVEEGGWLYIAWTEEKAPKQAGWNPQKVYQGVYARPGQPDPMAGQPAYQAPAQQPAAPQQAYQPSPQAYNQAVAATGMDPQYATPAMQQAAYQAQQQPAAAPPAAAQQDPQYLAWLASQGQQAAPQPPTPQYNAAPPAQGGGAPAGWNPFGAQ